MWFNDPKMKKKNSTDVQIRELKIIKGEIRDLRKEVCRLKNIMELRMSAFKDETRDEIVLLKEEVKERLSNSVNDFRGLLEKR